MIGNIVTAANDVSQPLITTAAAASVDVANQLLTMGVSTYTNDSNGNRLSESSTNNTLTYQWDSRNRLSSMVGSNGIAAYFKYDYNRNLLELDRTEAGLASSQKFVVDSLTNVVAITDSSGLPYSVLTGRTVDSHYASENGTGMVTFGIEDSLGSEVGVVDASGSLISRLEYEPFGVLKGSEPATYPFTFTGRVPIFANVVYLRNRYYDAGAGRFLSEDPAGAKGGDNLYEYAGNNPLGFEDPAGLWRRPDYYSLSAGVPFVSLTLSVDAYGDVFLGGGVGFGKGGLKLGASLNANYLLAPDSAICQASLYSFLHGTTPSQYGQTFGVGAMGGVTYTESSSGMYSVGAGLATPGGGYTTGPTYCKRRSKNGPVSGARARQLGGGKVHHLEKPRQSVVSQRSVPSGTIRSSETSGVCGRNQ